MSTKIQWCEKVAIRFWSKVKRSTGCWTWQAGLFSNGYGQFRLGKKKIKAHRLAYVMYFGEIPAGKIVCHKCDNKKCVRPSHLFLGTHKDNALDREKKNRGGDGGSKTKRWTGMVRGTKNPAHKLTPLYVRTIRHYRKRGYTYLEIQKGLEFTSGINISTSQIANVVKGRCWSYVK